MRAGTGKTAPVVNRRYAVKREVMARLAVLAVSTIMVVATAIDRLRVKAEPVIADEVIPTMVGTAEPLEEPPELGRMEAHQPAPSLAQAVTEGLFADRVLTAPTDKTAPTGSAHRQYSIHLPSTMA